MLLRGTTSLKKTRVETCSFGIAARMTSFIRLVIEFRCLRMHTAVVYLSTDEFLVTERASELLKSCEHLPEDLRPCDLPLSEKQDELVNVPVFIALMLGDHITVEVDKEVSLGTLHPLPLITSVHGSTVDASV